MSESTETVLRALRKTNTVAAVGLGNSVDRPAWDVCRYLQDIGLTIVPVHPTAREVHGEQAYPRLGDIPADVVLDTVCLFVRPEIGEEIVDEALARDDAHTIWMQPGATTEPAARRAEKAGKTVVRDACMMVAYRLHTKELGLSDD